MKALADHPVAWCKDFQGGRSFYTNVGANGDFSGADVRSHLAGALQWTAGEADPVYSDCGATVLANYQQTKISVNPNLNEPIGFDVLPDGRVLQTARGGQLRLHDPKDGSTKVIATLRSTPTARTASTGRRSTTTSPTTAGSTCTTRRRRSSTSSSPTARRRRSRRRRTTRRRPTAPSLSAWDPYVGYFQLSRFKFVDGATPTLDLASEQKILRVSNNRGACCHVAGDIDFDTHNNLWLVTGDDTPSGGGNSGGFSPHNDMKTDETQTVRARRRHVHADLRRPDDGAARLQRDAGGDPGRARGALQRRSRRRDRHRRPGHAQRDRAVRRPATRRRTCRS